MLRPLITAVAARRLSRLRVWALPLLLVCLAPAASTAQPAVTASLYQNVSVPDGWGGDLSFGAPTFDTAGFWSSAQPTRYTIPAGVSFVQLTATVNFDYTCTVCTVYVVKNGSSQWAFSYGATANTGFGYAPFTAITPVIPVEPGDYFTVRTYQNTGSPVTTGVGFSIVMVSPAPGYEIPLTARLEKAMSLPDGWSPALSFNPLSGGWDTGGLWNSGAPTRLTVPSGVNYVQVSATATFDYTCTVCIVKVWKNGSEIVASGYGSTANTGFGGVWQTAFASVVAVSPGDYFEVQTYQNTGAALPASVWFTVTQLDGFGHGSPPKTAATSQPVSVPNGWTSNLPFTATTSDTAGFWSSAQPTRFTVPADLGHVQVSAQANFSYTCTVCMVYVVKNDRDVVATSYGATANTGFGDVWFTALAPSVAVQAGDYFTVRAYQNSGEPLTSTLRLSIIGLGSPMPTIARMTPSWGATGTPVTLHGANFGTATGTVTFHNGQTASVTSWTASSITVTVPSGATTGGVTVVTAAGFGSNVVPFAVGAEEMVYLHTDAIGSVRMITGADGLVLERHDFQPFGEEIVAAALAAHDGFGGKERDAETESSSWMALNYFGARHLHAASGRFTSVDPIRISAERLLDPQQQGLFAFVRNNPLRFVDPDGRNSCLSEECIARLGRATGDAFVAAPCSTDICVAVSGRVSEEVLQAEADWGVASLLEGRRMIDRCYHHECEVQMAGLPNPAVISTSVATFGIAAYNQLRPVIQATGLQAHHLIEQRFAPAMGQIPRQMQSIALDPKTHQMFTNAWRAAIRYGDGTRTAQPADIMAAASKIYANYPLILRALGLP